MPIVVRVGDDGAMSIRRVTVAVSLVAASALAACGGSEPRDATPGPHASAKAAEVSEASQPAGAELEVSKELRRMQPKETACGAGDVCGFFLQVASPGSDPERLARLAVKTLEGKCGGHVIIYRDKRDVMGSGVVLKTADEKRACEEALGRPEDHDFPGELVFRVAP